MKNVIIKYKILPFIFCFVYTLTNQVSLKSQSIQLKWVNFSPYTKMGQNPNQNTIIPDSQIICLLDTLRPWFEGIRTFGTQYGLENIPHLAKERGFKVIVGIWLGNNNTAAGAAANDAQIANGIAIANAGYADKVIVGSETLFRNDLEPSELIAYINEVKQAISDTIPVSTADICSELIEHPEVVDVCDFVAPNIYPFWEGSPIECAMQRFYQCYLDLLSIANGKEIFISESGWKTVGNPIGEAIPSFENAIRYNRELLAWSQAFNVDVNLFSAFDEPWKLPNDDGWGIFFSDKTMKPGMDTLFTPIDIIDTTWLCEQLNNMSADTLYVDYIPVIGSFSPIKGHVDHLNPCDYKIATYIKVGGWWTKPTSENPAVPILCNGQWSVDYTTGGQDELATDICLFIVPCGYTPPICLGCGSIPQEVYQNAIDWECINRYSLPSAALIVSTDTICYGDSITLTASGGEFYLWKSIYNGGEIYLSNPGDTASSITVLPTNYPYSTYSVEISDGIGGGQLITKTVFVEKLSVVVLNDIACLNDTATLHVHNNTTYNIVNYLWSTGSNTDTLNVLAVLPVETYSVTVTSTEGCTDTGSGNVYSEYTYIQTSDDSICIGQYASMYSWGISSIWSTGDTTHNSSIQVFPDTIGMHIYSVITTTPTGCVFELQDTIFVFPLPVPTLTSIPNPVCLGDTAILVAGGGILYDWVGSEFDSIPFTVDSIFVTPNTTRYYEVKVSNEGCFAYKSTQLVVADSFSLSLSTSKDTIILGETATLTANGGDLNSLYTWNTGETTSSIQVSPSLSTEYLVTVTNSEGCSRLGSIMVYVSTTVATHEAAWIESLTIQPNPTTGEFQIFMHTNILDPILISVVNEYGQILEERTELPASGTMTSKFNLSHFPKGIYFLKISSNQEHQIIRKIVNQ